MRGFMMRLPATGRCGRLLQPVRPRCTAAAAAAARPPTTPRTARFSSTCSPYDEPSTMAKCEANYQPLTPLRFLERTAATFPEHPAIIYGPGFERSYSELYSRSRRLAAAVAAAGVGHGDTVSVMLGNTPQMLEAHYGVPMSGGVLNAINTRLDPQTVAYILGHCEPKLLLVDTGFSATVAAALELLAAEGKPVPAVVDVIDTVAEAEAGAAMGERIGSLEYEELVASGDPEYGKDLHTSTHASPPPLAHTHAHASRNCAAPSRIVRTHGPIAGLFRLGPSHH